MTIDLDAIEALAQRTVGYGFVPLYPREVLELVAMARVPGDATRRIRGNGSNGTAGHAAPGAKAMTPDTARALLAAAIHEDHERGCEDRCSHIGGMELEATADTRECPDLTVESLATAMLDSAWGGSQRAARDELMPGFRAQATAILAVLRRVPRS
jgi:hypothetical protein